jgi:hypothetical protein
VTFRLKPEATKVTQAGRTKVTEAEATKVTQAGSHQGE